MWQLLKPLQRRYNERYGFSNHQSDDWGADQREHQSSASLDFKREFTGDRWIPRKRASNPENYFLHLGPFSFLSDLGYTASRLSN